MTQKKSLPFAKKKNAPKKTMSSSKKKKPPHQTQVNYVVSDSSLTVNYSKSDHGRISFHTKSFQKGTSEYDSIKKAISEGKLSSIPRLASEKENKVKEYTASFKEKFISFENGGIKIDGTSIGDSLSKRILAYAEQGLPYMDLVNFWRNLQLNPSYRAVQGLFRFLEANHFPLTKNGFFIAYKGVTADFKDCRTQTFDNSPGKIVKMHRNQVNEDPEVTCSYGLHAASFSYAHGQYGSGTNKVIEVLINPKDVVAVPTDYNDAKMRVCEYKVIGVSAGEIKETRSDINDSSFEDDEEEIDDDDDGERGW